MSTVDQQIENFLAEQTPWQRGNLEQFRRVVHSVAPGVVEDWKWGVPVFLSGKRLVCAMSSFREHTKYNFFEGAALTDPHNLFNSGLDSKKHRSINLAEGEELSTENLSELVKQAFKRAQA